MKLSVKGAVRAAKQEDAAARRPTGSAATLGSVKSLDSFVNFAHKLGVGADNALTSGTYGYNPITRNRTLLEWIHRGSWLGGVAVDVVADDMTRNGIDFLAELGPGDAERLETVASQLGIWDNLNEAIKWGRLYGGSLEVLLIDGQDLKTPLRLETVGRGQFKGTLTLDRWMVEPSLSDMVTEYGPHLGKPKYYTVQSNAPALRGQVIHYSRVAARFEGVQLSYQQRLTENLWGISVLERLYDRMIAFDSASTGAAQLVFKAHLRTLKIPGLREIVAAGGKPLNGLMAYTEIMRRFQGIEGVTMIDGEDEFDVQTTSAFSGVNSVIDALGAQLSGALQIPLTRLFGSSPGGLNSTGESDLRTYYDGIQQQQRKHMSAGVNTIYRLIAQSEGIKLPDNFAVDFASLWQLNDTEKASVAKSVVETVEVARSSGLISDQVALMELRQSSRTTGIFTNITQALIDAADDAVQPPVSELDLAQLKLGVDGEEEKEEEEDGTLPGEEKPKTKDSGGRVRRVLLLR